MCYDDFMNGAAACEAAALQCNCAASRNEARGAKARDGHEWGELQPRRFFRGRLAPEGQP